MAFCSYQLKIKLRGSSLTSISKAFASASAIWIAEYASLLRLVKKAQRLGIENLYIQGDSQLIINQVNGVWKAKDPRMKQYRDRVLATLKHIKQWELKHVLRNHNKEADSLT